MRTIATPHAKLRKVVPFQGTLTILWLVVTLKFKMSRLRDQPSVVDFLVSDRVLFSKPARANLKEIQAKTPFGGIRVVKKGKEGKV